MKKKINFQKSVMIHGVGSLVMALLVIALVVLVTCGQNILPTLNHVSMLRGATQRLVKLELCGYPQDELIAELDGVIKNLLTGEGDYNLKRLNDAEYLESLTKQNQMWQVLRQEISDYRAGETAVQLLTDSEEYYRISADTLAFSRDYSSKIELAVRIINFVLITFLALYLWSSIKGVKALMVKNSQLKEQTKTDGFTDLPNRFAAQELIDSHRNPQDCVGHACLMFDLNNLKSTNDTQGHQTGDDLIVTFAGILRSYSSEGVFVARMGGDEFMLVTGETTQETAEQILDSIAKRTQVHNALQKSLYLSYSVGMAANTTTNPLNLQQLVKLADARMYENKRANKLQM